MLSAMSYSVELLGSVLVGLGIGYATFFELDCGLDGDDEGDEGENGGGGGYEEVGGDDDGAYEGTTTPARSGGRNGNYASNTSTATVGAASSCCDVPGRGPPRRAFQFLRSPVTTLAGVGRNRRRISDRGSDGSDEHNDTTNQTDALALHDNDGDEADNLSLHEDDKMTPLL